MPFLGKLYEEWFGVIEAQFPSEALVLELGSRSGFLNKLMSFPITCELFPTPSVDIVFDAQVIDMAEAFFDGVV